MELARFATVTRSVVAVTGATGCLGRALVSRLVATGAEVRAISRAGVPVPGCVAITADVRDAYALEAAFENTDAVFHLAAYAHDLTSIDDTEQQESVTLGGTLAALAAAERARVTNFVFASSLAVYGAVGGQPVNEDAACNPVTPYGRAKLAAERAVVEFATRTGAFAASIRPAMIYGVGCRGNLPRMIRAVDSRRFPPIPEFGNQRSMVSDSDAASALVQSWKVRVRGGRAFIVTDGLGYSTRELYELILATLGRTPPRITIPAALFSIGARIGDVGGRVLGRRFPFDSNAFERLKGSAVFESTRASELGYVPTTTLRDRLPAIIQHLQSGRA